MRNDRAYEEIELEKVQKVCKPYGYMATESFGKIYIRSKYERWYFSPQMNGVIRLMHGGLTGERWHTQFVARVTYKDIVCYIHEHETAKYCRFVNFTFTKSGQKKTA